MSDMDVWESCTKQAIRMAAEKAVREGRVVKIVSGGEVVGFMTPQSFLPPATKFVTFAGLRISTSSHIKGKDEG